MYLYAHAFRDINRCPALLLINLLRQAIYCWLYLPYLSKCVLFTGTHFLLSVSCPYLA